MPMKSFILNWQRFGLVYRQNTESFKWSKQSVVPVFGGEFEHIQDQLFFATSIR